METIKQAVTCPYCGKIFGVDMGIFEYGNVCLCPCDEGGCDQYFVAKLHISTSTLKLEGYGIPKPESSAL